MVLLLCLLFYSLVNNRFSKNTKATISDEKILTTTCIQLLDLFVSDSLNKKRISDTESALVLNFRDQSDKDFDLWIYDAELADACVNMNFLVRFKGFCVFVRGEYNYKYVNITSEYRSNNCELCNSMLNNINRDSIIYLEYDPVTFKVYRNTHDLELFVDKVVSN